LKRSCDYIEVKGRNISEPKAISKGFKNRETAGQIFPYLANPKRLSSRFRVGGGNCLGKFAVFDKGSATQPVAKDIKTDPAPDPDPDPEPDPGPPGTGNEGQGNAD
jgi:hypothetical protein